MNEPSRPLGGWARRCASVALCWWLAALALVVAEGSALAYPQYVGRGEFDCRDCHYNPTGGGLINQWGRQSREVTFGPGSLLGSSPDDWWGHDSAEGTGTGGEPELQLDLGGDARLLALVPTGTLIPMLVEAAAVAAYGSWSVYGAVTSRKGSPGSPVVAYSREHWLQYRVTDALSIRAGKLVLPFGVKMADHTQYARESLGFDRYDQSYALEVDWTAEAFTLSAAGYAGDLVAEDPALQERGGALRGTYVLADRIELGASARMGSNDATDRWAASGHLRARLVSDAYLIGEVAYQNLSSRLSSGQAKLIAAFGRLGYFVLPELDVHAELGYQSVQGAAFRKKSRVGLGANWQAWHWLEVVPQVVVENQEAIGTQTAGLVQVHLSY